MSDLVPNLAELSAALPAHSPARDIVAVFDNGDLSTVRTALRALADVWELAADYGADKGQLN